MKDVEIIEYLKSDKEQLAQLKISANLNVLAKAMIEKGWFTEEKYTSLVDKSIDLIANEIIKKLSQEERRNIEAQIQIANDPLFGMLFKK